MQVRFLLGAPSFSGRKVADVKKLSIITATLLLTKPIMLKKLCALLFSLFLLAGCMENRYPDQNPTDTDPIVTEETNPDDVTDNVGAEEIEASDEGEVATEESNDSETSEEEAVSDEDSSENDENVDTTADESAEEGVPTEANPDVVDPADEVSGGSDETAESTTDAAEETAVTEETTTTGEVTTTDETAATETETTETTSN